MVYFMENPIKMDDLGVPLFLETSKCCVKTVAQIPLIMIFADVAKGVAKEALAENIRTMAAVFSFLIAETGN